MEKVIATDHLIRVKVTDICPLQCNFCHKEGTKMIGPESSVTKLFEDASPSLPSLTDIPDDEQTISYFQILKNLGIQDVRLTGGEPTTYSKLPSLVKKIRQEGLRVKLTTNGQLSPHKLAQIINSGVEMINFSIFALDPKEFVRSQNGQSLEQASEAIERIKNCVSIAQKLDVNMAINTVVFRNGDNGRIDQIKDYTDSLKIKLVLLPNLAEGMQSRKAAFNIAQKYGRGVSLTEYTNRSKAFGTYITDAGNFVISKYFTNYHPDIICQGCSHKNNSSCIEKYYGLRMEFRDKKPYIRLCLQTSNERTVMPLQEFIDKDIYHQL